MYAFRDLSVEFSVWNPAKITCNVITYSWNKIPLYNNYKWRLKVRRDLFKDSNINISSHIFLSSLLWLNYRFMEVLASVKLFMFIIKIHFVLQRYLCLASQCSYFSPWATIPWFLTTFPNFMIFPRTEKSHVRFSACCNHYFGLR